MCAKKLDTTTLAQRLKDESLVSRIFYEENIQSTNDFLMHNAKRMEEGTIVVAGQQNKGKGRRSRDWESPEGGLWVSLILKPKTMFLYPGPLTVMMGSTIAQDLGDGLNLPIKTKWPNDLYLLGKKLGGILLESHTSKGKYQWIVVGVGVNVNNKTENLSPSLRDYAVSLRDVTGGEYDLADILIIVLNSIYETYHRWLKRDHGYLRSKWKENSLLYGRTIFYKLKGSVKEGVVVGLNPLAELVIRNNQSLDRLSSENVEIIKIC